AEVSATSAVVPAPAIVIPEARVRAAPDNAPVVPDNAPVVLAPAVQDNVPAAPGQVAIAVRVQEVEQEGLVGMIAGFGVMIAEMIGVTISRPSNLHRFAWTFSPSPPR
ncbi:MAG TPA: hypothetical protein VFG14_01420, partial [Chthoniobacteraceae bacterium]|nr:hypothetical protein [Chthoniobacteraceae bacterium]